MPDINWVAIAPGKAKHFHPKELGASKDLTMGWNMLFFVLESLKNYAHSRAKDFDDLIVVVA